MRDLQTMNKEMFKNNINNNKQTKEKQTKTNKNKNQKKANTRSFCLTSALGK